ncbi:MAG: hypothetical protein PHH26_01165 [Candidatus Thermoplasmatota archaeon]|nr:hypothetical protein [Candidatus Thermoplasmatota archaeon]
MENSPDYSKQLDKIISLLESNEKDSRIALKWAKISVFISIINAGFIGAILNIFNSLKITTTFWTILWIVVIAFVVVIVLSATVYVWVSGFGATKKK